MTDASPGARPRRGFWLVLLLAAALRIGVGAWRGESLMHAGNGLYYIDWLADSLASGRGYSIDGIPNVFQQPSYVLALAAGYAILGSGWTAVLVVNSLIGVALVAATMRLARRLDPRAVLPAGVIVAVHPILVWHGNSVADTTLFSVALVGWLGATLRMAQTGRLGAAVDAGLCLGLAFLTRPSIAPLLPVGLVAVAWLRRSWRDVAVYAVVGAALAGAMTVPWMLRNHALTGSFPLIGTHGPESVWAANNPDAPRITARDSSYDVISAAHEGTELGITGLQFRLAPREAVERERHFRETALTWMRANPGAVLSMSLVRLGRMWDARYHPMRWGDDVVPGARRKDLVHRWTHGPVLLAAVLGLLLLLRRREERGTALVLLAVLLAYSVAHSVGAGYSRVRMPLDPLLCALAGCAVARLTLRRRA